MKKIVIENVEGKSAYDYLVNAGYEVHKVIKNQILDLYVVIDEVSYLVIDYGWEKISSSSTSFRFYVLLKDEK